MINLTLQKLSFIDLDISKLMHSISARYIESSMHRKNV